MRLLLCPRYRNKTGGIIVTAMAGHGEFNALECTVLEPERVDELGANRRSSRLMQEVHFPRAVRLRALVFQNYYTATITIEARTSMPPRQHGPNEEAMAESSWRTILEPRSLMAEPHLEDDAQDWHTYDTHDFGERPVLDAVRALRFHMLQPSPSWADFGVRHLQCYSFDGSESGSGNASSAAAPGPRAAGQQPHAQPEPGERRDQVLTHLGRAIAAARLAGEALRRLEGEESVARSGKDVHVVPPSTRTAPVEWRTDRHAVAIEYVNNMVPLAGSAPPASRSHACATAQGTQAHIHHGAVPVHPPALPDDGQRDGPS